MAGTIFDSLLNMLDNRTIGEVAHVLGQSTQGVSRGMEPSIAALLGGLASKSDDPNALRKILDTAPSTGTVSWSQAASSASDANSSLMAAGKRLLPALFGSSENAVTSGISRASGLSFGSISTLLTMAAPVVMGFISKHARDTGMNMAGLGNLLQRESATWRGALPSELNETFWPGKRTVETASPVVAQAVRKETSSRWLIPALCAAGLALGLIWLAGHAHRPTAMPPVSTGEASRLETPAPNVTCTLPATVVLPEGGPESRLLAFVQDPNAKVSANNWFNTDQLSFDTGSARLRPSSQAELGNIAAILANCPNVRMTIAGYTDNVGSAEANLRLSRDRSNAVVASLVNKGVSRDHLAAEGHGEENPVADNATAEGRARNRRVAMLVTQK